jgi:Protein of unknown function (DUF3108)
LTSGPKLRSHFALLKDKMPSATSAECSTGGSAIRHSNGWIGDDVLFARCSFALMMVARGEHAHAGAVSLEATYTISFARIRVGDITATVEVRDNEYAISARGRAGGIIKMLLDGEGSFITRGTIKDDHPVPTTLTSKIVSGAETSEVTNGPRRGRCCSTSRFHRGASRGLRRSG